MKAITVTYHGPTNFKGSRLIASDRDGNRAQVSYRSELNHDDNFRFAAIALCKKMNWDGKLVHGSLGSNSDVFVWLDSRETISTADTFYRQER